MQYQKKPILYKDATNPYNKVKGCLSVCLYSIIPNVCPAVCQTQKGGNVIFPASSKEKS